MFLCYHLDDSRAEQYIDLDIIDTVNIWDDVMMYIAIYIYIFYTLKDQI